MKHLLWTSTDHLIWTSLKETYIVYLFYSFRMWLHCPYMVYSPLVVQLFHHKGSRLLYLFKQYTFNTLIMGYCKGMLLYFPHNANWYIIFTTKFVRNTTKFITFTTFSIFISRDCKIVSPSSKAQDDDVAKRLWDISEEYVKGNIK